MTITQKLIDQMRWFWYQIKAISLLFIENSSNACFIKLYYANFEIVWKIYRNFWEFPYFKCPTQGGYWKIIEKILLECICELKWQTEIRVPQIESRFCHLSPPPTIKAVYSLSQIKILKTAFEIPNWSRDFKFGKNLLRIII